METSVTHAARDLEPFLRLFGPGCGVITTQHNRQLSPPPPLQQQQQLSADHPITPTHRDKALTPVSYEQASFRAGCMR
jgi:hypothetical protein